MQGLSQNWQHATWTEVRLARRFSWFPSRRHRFNWESCDSQTALPSSSDKSQRSTGVPSSKAKTHSSDAGRGKALVFKLAGWEETESENIHSRTPVILPKLLE